jgi:predicted dehydrogenase
MSFKSLDVLIVGCGNIAGKFDEGSSFNDLPLTHAGAFSKDSRYNISTCIDPDFNKRSAFAKRWSVSNHVECIDELSSFSGSFDVISICSPTGCHGADMDTSLSLKPKLIFCEKPVTISIVETAKLISECDKQKVFCAVNYSRRWDPDIHRLKEDIRLGLRGQLRSVVGVYNKGLLNNGSHMLDLLILLLGPLGIVYVGRPSYDWFPEDPSIPVWLETESNIPINISCGNANDFSFFEVQFVFDSGVLVMEDGGMFWRERKIIKSSTFEGYHNLDVGVFKEGAYKNSMTQALDNIWNVIVNGTELMSDGSSALQTQALCEKISKMTQGQGL